MTTGTETGRRSRWRTSRAPRRASTLMCSGTLVAIATALGAGCGPRQVERPGGAGPSTSTGRGSRQEQTGDAEPSTPGTLRFPDDVEHRQLDDSAARQRFRPPTALGFEGATVVRVQGRRLVLELWVTNPTPEVFPLVVRPYGGSFPYGGDNPLTLGFSDEALRVVTYTGELYPPEPPLPMEIVIPANSRVRFTAEIDLSRYSYDGGPEVALEWGFHLLEGEGPSGTIRVALP